MSEDWERDLTPPTPSDDEFAAAKLDNNKNELKENDGTPTPTPEQFPSESTQDAPADVPVSKIDAVDSERSEIPETETKDEGGGAMKVEDVTEYIKEADESDDELAFSFKLTDDLPTAAAAAAAEAPTEKPVEGSEEIQQHDQPEGSRDNLGDDHELKLLMPQIQFEDIPGEDDPGHHGHPLNDYHDLPSHVLPALQAGLIAAMEALNLDGSLENEHVMRAIIIQREIMNIQAEQLHTQDSMLTAKDNLIKQQNETIDGMKITMGIMGRKIQVQKEEMKNMEKKVAVAEESLLSKEMVLKSKDGTIEEQRRTIENQRYNIESMQRLIGMDDFRVKY